MAVLSSAVMPYLALLGRAVYVLKGRPHGMNAATDIFFDLPVAAQSLSRRSKTHP
jgi:hypothetical protein